MATILSLSQQYMLASRAKGKLLAAANKNSGRDHDLRILVGHANLLDRLSSSVAKFDDIVFRSSSNDYHYNEEEADDDEYSDSDSDEEQEDFDNAPPKYQHIHHSYVSSDSGSDSESDSDSDLGTNSDSSSSDSISDYDESNVRSKYLAKLQDLQDDSEDLDPKYSLSSQPALYKCPSQNLTLSSISLNLMSSRTHENNNEETHVTTLLLSDEDSDNEIEEDLGTLSPVYVL